MSLEPLTIYLLGIITILSIVGIIGYLDTKTSSKKSSKK